MVVDVLELVLPFFFSLPLGKRLFKASQDLRKPHYVHDKQYCGHTKYQNAAKGMHLFDLSKQNIQDKFIVEQI
jgi:hypothetical protein